MQFLPKSEYQEVAASKKGATALRPPEYSNLIRSEYSGRPIEKKRQISLWIYVPADIWNKAFYILNFAPEIAHDALICK